MLWACAVFVLTYMYYSLRAKRLWLLALLGSCPSHHRPLWFSLKVRFTALVSLYSNCCSEPCARIPVTRFPHLRGICTAHSVVPDTKCPLLGFSLATSL